MAESVLVEAQPLAIFDHVSAAYFALPHAGVIDDVFRDQLPDSRCQNLALINRLEYTVTVIDGFHVLRFFREQVRFSDNGRHRIYARISVARIDHAAATMRNWSA